MNYALYLQQYAITMQTGPSGWTAQQLAAAYHLRAIAARKNDTIRYKALDAKIQFARRTR